jgi:hypothetical protein
MLEGIMGKFLLIAVLLLPACSAKFVLPKRKPAEWVYFRGQHIVSTKVPEIMVAHIDGADWVTRVYSENFFLEALRKKGFKAIPSVVLFPPIREYAEVEILSELKRRKISALLLVRTNRELNHPMPLKGFFNEHFWKVSVNPPWGRKRPIPYATEIQMALLDVHERRPLWVGRVDTPNGVFQPVMKEMSRKAAESLKSLLGPHKLKTKSKSDKTRFANN